MKNGSIETSIVRQAISGSQIAWTQLVELYNPMVTNLAYHLVSDYHEAQDITQDVFLRAYTHRNQLKDTDKFVPWLRQITINICRTWHRRQKIKWVPLHTPHMQIVKPGTKGIGPCIPAQVQDLKCSDTEPSLERIETQDLVKKGLQGLSESLAVTLILYYQDALSYQEISKRLGIPVGTVKSRLYEARKQFKQEITSLTAGEPLQKYVIGSEEQDKKNKPHPGVHMNNAIRLPASFPPARR